MFWFTLSHGILNEIYYPRVDHSCTRDLGFMVTDGHTYFSEEKRDAHSETSQVALGVPAYHIRNTAVDGRYRLEKEVLTDPWRDVVLQRVRFVPLQGTLAEYRFYALLAPHLANRGSGNTAWVGDYKGMPMLLAERESFALALASSAPWPVLQLFSPSIERLDAMLLMLHAAFGPVAACSIGNSASRQKPIESHHGSHIRQDYDCHRMDVCAVRVCARRTFHLRWTDPPGCIDCRSCDRGAAALEGAGRNVIAEHSRGAALG